MKSLSAKLSTSFQIRNSYLRFDISQHADNGNRALQSTTSHLLRPRGVKRVLHDRLRSRGDRENNRSALSLLYGAVESVRLPAGVGIDTRYTDGGHHDRLPCVPDALASREGVQNRQNLEAHQGRERYPQAALRPRR